MTTWRKVGFCLATVAGLGFGASSAEQPAGARLRGFVSVAGRPNLWTIWEPFNGSDADWTDGGTSSEILYDVGSPHTLSGLGFVPRNQNNGTILGRCKNAKVYGMTNRDDPVSAGTLLFNSGEGPFTLGNIPNWLDAKAPLTPYRYYKIECNANPNFHMQFYCNEPMVTQNRCVAWDWTKVGCEDSESGVTFTGSVLCLAEGDTASVCLMVARTDHDDDSAAWLADPTCVTKAVSGIVSGGTYTLKATDGDAPLDPGRWFARVFLDYTGKKTPSQCSAEFVVGSSAYLPVAYFAQGQGSLCSGTYDGVNNNFPDKNLTPCRVIWALEDVDRELVAIRVWPRAGQDQNSRCLPTRFLTSPSIGSFGAVTDVKTVNNHVIRDAELDPVSDWKLLTQLCEQDLYVPKTPETYFEIPVTLPDRHTRYIKMDGFTYYNISEVEFRTLPRPATPEATMELGTIGGSYVGLSGFLDYRGNGATSCDVYAACTKSGEAPVYKCIATGWENETPWAGTISKLTPETEYALSVIVSNQAAGVEVLTTSFTTGEATDEPPEVSLVSVTPNADGTVTFAWDAVTLGTDAETCDLLVSWGKDAEHQEAPVALATIAATGPGSTLLETVPLGTNLVFVLSSENDQGKSGKPSSSGTITLPGPSSFESSEVEQSAGFGLKATGRLAVVGLGTTDVYINWGTTEGVFDQWQKIGSYDATSESLVISGATEVGSVPFVWARLVASNGFGSASWIATGDTFKVLLGTVLPANVTAGSDIAAYARNLSDGNLGNNFDAKGPYSFDFGSLHTLSGLRFAVRSDGVWTDLTKTMSVELSANGKDWTCVWSNATGKAMAAGGVKHEIRFETLPKARFARVTALNVSSGFMDFGELAFLAMDMSITALQTHSWVGSSFASAATDERKSDICFSGKIAFGGPAHVYGCVAKEDYREDLEAWRAHGRVVDLGTFTAGETITGSLPKGVPGLYRSRLVAVTSSQTACSPEVQIVPLNTRVHLGAICVEASKAGQMKTVYDGAVGSHPDFGPSSPVIFRLDSRFRPVAVRFWPRNTDLVNTFRRTCSVRIAMTTDTAELASEEYASTPRPIRTFASDTLTDWKEIANVQYRSDLYENIGCWDIPLGKVPANATYLKIYNVENNNYREVEVRVVTPSGMALILR